MLYAACDREGPVAWTDPHSINGYVLSQVAVPGDKVDCERRLARPIARSILDPRMGPDRERSGVLHIGTILRGLIREDQRLAITAAADDTISID